MHPAAAVLDEHQDIQSAKQHSVHVQEVDGEDPRSPGRGGTAATSGPTDEAPDQYPQHTGSPTRWTARPPRRAWSVRHGSGGVPTADFPSRGERQGGRCPGPSAGALACAACSCRTCCRPVCGARPAASLASRGRSRSSACAVGAVPVQRATPGPALVTHPAGVSAQHRVLVPEHQQLSTLRPVAAEHRDGQAECPARQQVYDLEHHPASQPSLRSSSWPQRRSTTQSSIRAAQDRAGPRTVPWPARQRGRADRAAHRQFRRRLRDRRPGSAERYSSRRLPVRGAGRGRCDRCGPDQARALGAGPGAGLGGRGPDRRPG